MKNDISTARTFLWVRTADSPQRVPMNSRSRVVLAGECTLIVEEEKRPLRQWDYFHCPADIRHVIVGAGDGPCAVLMLGARPEFETLHYPVSEVAARCGASAASETDEPDEAYADWPGEYLPVRLPWPLDSETKG